MNREAPYEILAEGSVLADGGTGTSLLSTGIPGSVCVEALVVEGVRA